MSTPSLAESGLPGILPRSTVHLPTIFTARPEARTRMRDFFSSHIRNPNTRRAYREAVRQFSCFCAEHGIVNLAQCRFSFTCRTILLITEGLRDS